MLYLNYDYRRYPGERFRNHCLLPTVKHGNGSIMVWGGVTGNGVAPLKRITGIIRQEAYHQILIRHAIPAGLNLIGRGFIFQQDNDPKHTSNLCRNYIDRKHANGKSFLVINSHKIVFVVHKDYTTCN